MSPPSSRREEGCAKVGENALGSDGWGKEWKQRKQNQTCWKTDSFHLPADEEWLTF